MYHSSLGRGEESLKTELVSTGELGRDAERRRGGETEGGEGGRVKQIGWEEEREKRGRKALH